MSRRPTKPAWDVVLFDVVPIVLAVLFALVISANFGLFDAN